MPGVGFDMPRVPALSVTGDHLGDDFVLGNQFFSRVAHAAGENWQPRSDASMAKR